MKPWAVWMGRAMLVVWGFACWRHPLTLGAFTLGLVAYFVWRDRRWSRVGRRTVFESLAEGPTRGLHLRRRTQDPSVYSRLSRLQDAGLIESEPITTSRDEHHRQMTGEYPPRGRVYWLTEAGIEEARRMGLQVDAPSYRKGAPHVWLAGG